MTTTTNPHGTTMTSPPQNRSLAFAMAAAALLALTLPFTAASAQAPERERIVSSSMSVSSGTAALELELADGATHRIRFSDGEVTLDGESLGTYEPGGALETAWRRLLAEGLQGTGGFSLGADRLRGWAPPGGSTAEALTGAIDELLAPEPPAAGGGDTVSMTGPGGETLAIAPGRLSVDELVTRLSHLRSSLARLGDEAEEAAGELALVVHDDYAVDEGRVVDGNLALLDGELRLAGRVRGDAVVLDGTLVLEPGSSVEGNVFQAGGEVERAGGRVAGEFLSIEPLAPAADPAPPTAAAPDVDIEERVRDEVRSRMREYRERERPGFFGRLGNNVGRAFGGVLGVVSSLVLLGVAGALTVYFGRSRLETVAETIQANPARSFGVGFAGQLLFVPVLVVLCVAIITILVVPLFVVGTAVALIGGYVAVAHLTGETLARQRYRYEWMERLRRSNAYFYVFSGLVALLAPFALAETLHVFGGWLGWLRGLIHFSAAVLTWVAVTAGFGAVLLSRGGERREYARPRGTGESGATAEAGV